MTRLKNVESADQEQRITEALEGVQSGRFKTYREAARALDVPKSTLCYRAQGRSTRIGAHEDEQILSNDEETELVEWIKKLTLCGYPPKRFTVQEMAQTIRTRRVIGINNATATLIQYDEIGEQWVTRFMNRHPELQSVIPEQIEAARIHESLHSVIQKWFDDVKSIINRYDIQPQDISNMDETGYSISSIKATCVIIDRTQNIRYAAHPGHQEWVTVIECISMDGSALLPLIIFKGKSLVHGWIPEQTPKTWFFSVNTEGWTSNAHTQKWLLEDFEPHTSAKANGRTRLLIFDGHGSHTTADVVRHCILNRVQLALLPPHTSHLTQPLDVGVFSSMKAHMSREMDRYIRTGIPRIQKAEWLDAFIVARLLAFTARNIRSGWSGTGLQAFNLEKVRSRVPPPAIMEPPIRQVTPEYDTPLHNPQLTSSPIATPDMDAANTCIQQCANDRSAIFNTPERTHVVRIVRALNRSLARNRIQTQQLSELQQIMTTRKRRQSGKHHILCGETIIATPEMLERLEKAEAATKARKPRRRKTTHPLTPIPQPIANSTEMDDLHSDSDEDILDCIVVHQSR